MCVILQVASECLRPWHDFSLLYILISFDVLLFYMKAMGGLKKPMGGLNKLTLTFEHFLFE